MKTVFIGPTDSGKSTLINRVLGEWVFPIRGSYKVSSRIKTTFHNVSREGYKATIHLVPKDSVDVASLDAHGRKELYRLCWEQFVMGDKPKDSPQLKDIPWERLYDLMRNAADDISQTLHPLSVYLCGALKHFMSNPCMELFVKEIVIEGRAPNLGPGDIIVELPCEGFIQRSVAQLRKELAGATQVFCALDLRNQHNKDVIGEYSEFMPPGIPLHVCFTHGVDALRKMAGSIDDSGNRMRREVHLRDLVDVGGFGNTLVKNHTVTTRVFDSGDETGLDIHMLKELIEFIKRGGRM